ncbi:MAG TPA: histidine phosphatase family protein [Candidatus Limnocylindrales bacterium]|nr:histidine phosphatase family protein [Candidatus Limnocylindrales bacterium]
MLTLLLTRHGHTLRSEPEQYLGQRIVAPLSDRGRVDAERLASRLAGVQLDRVLSSPLGRAMETAEILAGRRTVEPDDRLMELDYGAFEGVTVAEIEQRFPAEQARYSEDPSTFVFPGGESGLLVAERVRDFIDQLLGWWEKHGDQRVVLAVGHSSLNRIMLAVLLGAPLADYRRRFQFDWAGLTVLRWTSRAEGPQLLLANDACHLPGTSDANWG